MLSYFNKILFTFWSFKNCLLIIFKKANHCAEFFPCNTYVDKLNAFKDELRFVISFGDHFVKVFDLYTFM